jgi:uncharacterized damage-inducible protein DinB
MTLRDMFLAQLEREAPRTRRVLEQVPTGRDDWKPHDKSMPLGRLAGMVASMPSWFNLILEQDELDLTPPPGAGQHRPPAKGTLVETHDAVVPKAREAFAKVDDKYLLTTTWRLKAGGKIVANDPRHIVIADTMNHLAHHRGQLTVYLRLLGRTVPSVFGPSADDQRFL